MTRDEGHVEPNDLPARLLRGMSIVGIMIGSLHLILGFWETWPRFSWVWRRALTRGVSQVLNHVLDAEFIGLAARGVVLPLLLLFASVQLVRYRRSGRLLLLVYMLLVPLALILVLIGEMINLRDILHHVWPTIIRGWLNYLATYAVIAILITRMLWRPEVEVLLHPRAGRAFEPVFPLASTDEKEAKGL